MTANNIVIRAEALTKIFKVDAEEITAVDRVDLEIRAGEFVSIMGPSGSGKTTLLDLLGCLERSTNGQLEIQNQRVSGLSEYELAKIRRGRIGFVFQDFSLIPTLTAQENIMLAVHLIGRKPDAQKAKEHLEQVGLGHRCGHLPKQMSGGEKQRVAIARALSVQPAFLIADEPTGQLDSHNSQGVIDLFKRLNRQGLTIILATHDQLIGSQAKRMIQLLDGRVIRDEESAC